MDSLLSLIGLCVKEFLFISNNDRVESLYAQASMLDSGFKKVQAVGFGESSVMFVTLLLLDKNHFSILPSFVIISS